MGGWDVLRGTVACVWSHLCQGGRCRSEPSSVSSQLWHWLPPALHWGRCVYAGATVHSGAQGMGVQGKHKAFGGGIV